MHDHHNTGPTGPTNNTNDPARNQMLAVLEEFWLWADPDTVRALDQHLADRGISVTADQLIAELGRLVATSQTQGGHRD